MDDRVEPLMKTRAARSLPKQTLVPQWFGAMRRALRAVLLSAVVVVVFVEEWGWGPLSGLVARLAHWPPIAALESHIRRASPRFALALFLLPAVALVPVKLLAIYMIEDGRVALGILVLVAAKLVGTALVGRLFVLVEKQLMQFVWFATFVGWWRVTRERIMTAVRASSLWRNGLAMRSRWRDWMRRGKVASASPEPAGDLAASRSYALPVVSISDGRPLAVDGARLSLLPSRPRADPGGNVTGKLLTFAVRAGLVVLLMGFIMKTSTRDAEAEAGAPPG